MTTLSNCSAGEACVSVSAVFLEEWTAMFGMGNGDKTLGRRHPKIDFVAAQSAKGPVLHFSKRSSKMNKSGSGTASKMKYSATKPKRCQRLRTKKNSQVRFSGSVTESPYLCVQGSILPQGIK
jgi:hypothetical protein